MASTLLVNEIFGPTYQGEGPFTGRGCAFVRLAICPLRCSWCDTAYTWAYTPALASKHQSQVVYDRDNEVHEMEVDDVTDQAEALCSSSRMVVLSGGEPLAQIPPRLQRPGETMFIDEEDPVGMLVFKLYTRNVSVHIETAGIRFPSPMVRAYTSRFIVSPKLQSSGNPTSVRQKIDVLHWFAQSASADFKFVVTSLGDFNEIDHVVKLLAIPGHRVWAMPEGTTNEAITEKLPMVAEGALKRGYNISTRLHVSIWGDKRGH